MKVYVVTAREKFEDSIICICSNKELAETEVKKNDCDSLYGCFVREFEVLDD